MRSIPGASTHATPQELAKCLDKWVLVEMVPSVSSAGGHPAKPQITSWPAMVSEFVGAVTTSLSVVLDAI